jgi:hypothetical protein
MRVLGGRAVLQLHVHRRYSFVGGVTKANENTPAGE